MTNSDLSRQIANAHTIFNGSIVLLIMPMIGFFRILVEKIVPGEVIESFPSAI